MAERVIRQAAIPIVGGSEIPRIQFSSGAAQALQTFSRDMFSLSNGFQDQLDEQAQAEATVQGSVAGASGTMPELQDYGTIRGRAFNKAAVETFVTTLDTQGIVKMAELQSQFATDPAGLQAAIADYSRGVTKEVEKAYPPAAAAFSQRMKLRELPAVEAAKDARFKMTRDQADAALIENQVAIKAEVQAHAADLFSNNPERSSAAAAAVGAFQDDYLKVFESVDPVTGRPLYTAEEKAKAKVGFYNDVMESAALSWFDQQGDKAGAYQKFTEGNFTIDLKSPGGAATYTKGDATAFLAARTPGKGPDATAGLNGSFAGRLAGLIDSAPPEIRRGLQLLSGHRTHARQAALFAASDRTGRTVARPGHSLHESGFAADLMWNGQRLDKAPAQVKAWVHQNAAQFGLKFPMSYEPWHIEAGETRGGKGNKTPGPMSASVDVRKALGPAAMDKIATEMRSRISFNNTLEDRAVAQAEKQEKLTRDHQEFNMTNRILGDGANDAETGKPLRPVTREEIQGAVARHEIDAKAGEAMVKLMTTEKPDKSDPAVLRDLQKRMWAGEDIYPMIVDQADKLSGSDRNTLYSSNQANNKVGDGMTKDQRFYMDALKDRLTPDGMMAAYDERKDERKFAALGEFRRRVLQDGEDPEVVSDDLVTRATIDANTIDQTKLGGMVMPRFSVPIAGQHRIDVQASAAALVQAYKTKQLTGAEYARQGKLLKQWADLQSSLAITDAAAAKKKAAK